jgi:hypothetical protein
MSKTLLRLIVGLLATLVVGWSDCSFAGYGYLTGKSLNVSGKDGVLKVSFSSTDFGACSAVPEQIKLYSTGSGLIGTATLSDFFVYKVNAKQTVETYTYKGTTGLGDCKSVKLKATYNYEADVGTCKFSAKCQLAGSPPSPGAEITLSFNGGSVDAAVFTSNTSIITKNDGLKSFKAKAAGIDNGCYGCLDPSLHTCDAACVNAGYAAGFCDHPGSLNPSVCCACY